MNKWLSITALVASIVFTAILALAYIGVDFTLIAASIVDFLILPYYCLIIISLVYTVVKWIKNRNKSSFRYMLYSIISFILTCGIVLYVIFQYGVTMSNFE